MKIIESPNIEILKSIQKELENESELEIRDIWGTLNPVYVVAFENNKPIAVATVHGSGCLELYKLYVIPEYRGKGIGEELFNYVAQALRQNGHKELFVEMVENSIPFWEKISTKYSYNQIESTYKVFFNLEKK